MKYFFLVIPLLILLNSNVLSQGNVNQDEIAWFDNTNKYQFSDKVFAKTELHFRRINFMDSWQQIMFRPQVHYSINDGINLGGGYSFFIHYPYGVRGVSNTGMENNLWQQLSISNKAGAFSFHNRLRMEERFLQLPVLENDVETTNSFYTNRFRYRLTMKVKLREKNEKTTSLSLFNEVFINLYDNFMIENFDQNWIGAGLSQEFSKSGSFHVGFLHQWVGRGDSFNYAEFFGLTAGINFKLDFRKN